MTAYSDLNYKTIAAAIGKEIADNQRHGQCFESAALWYRLDKRSPKRIPPSRLQQKLISIEKAAARLLKHLGVSDLSEATNGPRDMAILDALNGSARDEDRIIAATGRIGRLAVLLGAIQSAATLQQTALAPKDKVKRFGELTAHEAHNGKIAINDWIAALMGIYAEIAGREPATSVGSAASKTEGIAEGPLIRFLELAGKL